MDENQLFTAMFKEDVEGQKLIMVPGADELMSQFEQKFTGLVRSMFEFGLKVNLELETILTAFRSFRKKNYVIMKLKIFGFVFEKPRMRILVVLQ